MPDPITVPIRLTVGERSWSWTLPVPCTARLRQRVLLTLIRRLREALDTLTETGRPT